MTCPDRDIMNILPLATIVGGELVYEKDNSQITVMLEGLPIGFDSVPILENGVTFVLAKNLFNALELEYTYNLRIQAIGYYTQNIIDVRVFPDTTTNFNINLIPVRQGGDEDEGQRTLIIPHSPIDESNV
jgi:hypothetical protein